MIRAFALLVTTNASADWLFGGYLGASHTPGNTLMVTPAAAVPRLISELAERGTRAVVIITAGFGELGSA